MLQFERNRMNRIDSVEKETGGGIKLRIGNQGGDRAQRTNDRDIPHGHQTIFFNMCAQTTPNAIAAAAAPPSSRPPARRRRPSLARSLGTTGSLARSLTPPA